MKVVKRTAEFTIYQKRSERYAVQSAAKKWINGDDKLRILIEAGLVKEAAPKPPEVEPEASAEASETDDSGADSAADDAPSEGEAAEAEG